MTFRRSNCQICLAAVALLTLGSLLVCNAQTRPRRGGRSIEFSLPRGSEVTTNVHQMTSKPDELKQWQENLYRRLPMGEPQSSLDGVIVPPTRPAVTSTIQSKRAKELRERRKNGDAMTPEDLLLMPNIEEMLTTSTPGKDSKKTADLQEFDQYFGLLSDKPSMNDDKQQPKDDERLRSRSQSDSSDDVAVDQDPNIPKNVREAVDKLNTQFESAKSDSPFAPDAERASRSDIFGFGNHTPSKEQTLERKKYMDEYRSVLDPTYRAPTADAPFNPFTPLSDTFSPAVKLPPTATGLPTLGVPRGFEAPADVALNPMLGPPLLPDVNAQALGQTRSVQALQKIDSPRVTPITPSFDAPRRSFR